MSDENSYNFESTWLGKIIIAVCWIIILIGTPWLLAIAGAAFNIGGK